mmetsp:Transcript_19891/g.59354  ORF Transcript_19891/g.59354 Transcript_19891/m.59354 type:complete len:115 (-) Transcript_19891:131-475(-)
MKQSSTSVRRRRIGGVGSFFARRRSARDRGQYAVAASAGASAIDAIFLHRYAAAAARPVATPAFFARRPRFARQASSGAAVIDDASRRTWWMRERGERGGVDVTRRLCKALGHL